VVNTIAAATVESAPLASARLVRLHEEVIMNRIRRIARIPRRCGGQGVSWRG
jgi:hypothetical protein